jgi:hypothetical protein
MEARMKPHPFLVAFLSSVVVLAVPVSLAGCGGRVSLGWDDQSNRLGAGDGGDGGTGGDGDPGSTDVGDFPWMALGGSMDGSVPSPGPDGFNEIIWERWWDCGGTMCAQQMQINAECQVIWASSSSHALSPGVRLDAAACADIMSATAEVDLRDALLDPTPCSGSGGETIVYRTYGHMGLIFQKRVEGCRGARGAFDAVRKFVVTAAGDVGISEEIHL